MKKEDIKISNPDELDKHLQSSSPVTWTILGVVIAMMIGFFVWSCIYKIPVKLSGKATVSGGQASLVVDEKVLNKLEAGQKVYVSNQEGILSFDVDHKPVVLNLTLEDGTYTYHADVVVKEIRPIDFLIK